MYAVVLVNLANQSGLAPSTCDAGGMSRFRLVGRVRFDGRKPYAGPLLFSRHAKLQRQWHYGAITAPIPGLEGSDSMSPQVETEAFTMSSEEIATLRAFYHAKHKAETTLNDEQIVALVEKTDGVEADAGDEWADLMKGVEQTLSDDDESGEDQPAKNPDNTQSMRMVRAKAAEFAAIIGKDEEFTALIHEKVKNDEAEGVRPLSIIRRFDAIIGKEGMAAAPLVGTDEKTAGNRLPDQYKYSIKNADGTTTPVSGSFWRDVANDLPEAKEIFASIDRMKKRAAERSGNKKPNADMLKKLTANIESIVKAVRTAARLYYQLARINSECGPVEAYHYLVTVRDEDGNAVKDENGKVVKDYTRSKFPIYIGSTENTAEAKDNEWEFYSVSQVLAFKVDKAKANGGGFTALINSSSRVKEPEGSKVPNATMDNLPAFIANLGLMLDDADNQKTIQKVCEKNHELLLALSDMSDNLSNLLGPFSAPRPKLGKPSLLRELLAQRAAAEEQAKADEVKAKADVKKLSKAS